VRIIRRWYRVSYQTRCRIILVVLVGGMLIAVLIADAMKLRNHP
jgi:hypothetical protein